MVTYCKKCLGFGKEGENLQEIIKGYIDGIDTGMKVDDTTYKKRLDECEECSDLMNGMCRHCGCFCIIRAIKKNQYCPHPLGDKWGNKKIL